jgi:hypothetical protein
MANIVAAMKQYMTVDKPSWSNVLPMTNAEELTTWEKLDDVIMGGSSSSGLEPSEDGKGAVWKGDLIVEVGGQRLAEMSQSLLGTDQVHRIMHGVLSAKSFQLAWLGLGLLKTQALGLWSSVWKGDLIVEVGGRLSE